MVVTLESSLGGVGLHPVGGQRATVGPLLVSMDVVQISDFC